MGAMASAMTRLLGAQGQEIEDRVAATHEAIAGRVFGALGPLGAPSRALHDVISATVHGSVRAALGGAGLLGGVLAQRLDDETLLASPQGRSVVGAVMGLIGDTVGDVEPDVAWPFVLLRDGEVVARDDQQPALVRAREVVVLLHGLCETDLTWSLGTGPARPGLPEALAAPGRVVLVARFNSGLRPAALGADLSALLDGLVAPGARVVLVGHSMGGLVARAAIRVAVRDDAAWGQQCDSLVTLGTPHLGAPLEKAVEVLVRAGALAPEVDAITRWFDQRSAGIRDLRHGVDDDHAAPGVRVAAAPLPSHVRLHTVGAALSGVGGTLVGDGLVRPVSAHGRGVRGTLRARRGPTLDIVGSHFDLVSHPDVVAHVRDVLDAQRSA